ncbi:MAG: hypothetical protein NVSMB64_13770 [Candidatus Velthaea sp.]
MIGLEVVMTKFIALGIAVFLGTSGLAYADETPDTTAKISALQQQLDLMKAQLDQLKAQQQKQTQAAAAAPAKTDGSAAVQIKKGPTTRLVFGGEEVQVYGNLDLSYDSTTKGLRSSYPAPAGDSPAGNVGWLSAISSNLSYIGIRGNHKIGKFSSIPYQLETQIDVSSTSGTVSSNSNTDNGVKGALTSRNSFIGYANKYFGAVKIGKTDAPYKNSTARLNPFSAELGDYAVIVGNSGGDNRVEFGTRFDHAIWYESPKSKNGLDFSFLLSPGQNRAFDNSLIPAGEVSCAGGNIPGSGATPPGCNDGSFGTAYSSALTYQKGSGYLSAAYEIHKRVNRSSDTANLDPADVADEQGTKFGAQYTFGKRTTVNALYEDLERYVPAQLQFQNERSRSGYWLALSQLLNPNKDTLSFGWGHANKANGDPGQHNTNPGAGVDNSANMYTFAYKHQIDRNVTFYIDGAETLNGPYGHYDLGAGGRGITTDCHDGSLLAAFDPTANNGAGGVSNNGPRCYAGGHLKGISTGLDIRF